MVIDLAIFLLCMEKILEYFFSTLRTVEEWVIPNLRCEKRPEMEADHHTEGQN